MDTYPESPARLDVDNISVGYNGTSVLQNITFQIPHGARVAVVGPNGAGKSTLFKTLVGLLPLREGKIFIHGLSLGHHMDCVAYVPQREEVDWRFPVTVQDVVMMGRFGHQNWLQRPGRADREVVEKSLRQMGMEERTDRSISDLSGGQQQRVFLARALAQEPHIFLMDEPFTGVDATTQEATLALLDHLRRQHVTVLISTHDLNLAASRFDSVLLLNRRVIAFAEPKLVFTPENLSRAFGSQMLKLPDGMVLVDECCPPEDEHAHDEAHK
ncbi:MAG TPA: metal ABC transporter ATP-binding protein [Anaerolineales bacterium]|nr:metal ABC transporter ATP-binding protein [Anaerolineales bacterium]